MSIDFNVVARVFKLVALIGFFLPWIAVSCSGTEIATGTGWQMMTGDLQPSGPLASMQEQSGAEKGAGLDEQDPSPYIIAAFAAIALGFLVSLVTRKRAAAGVILAGAVIGAGLSFYSFENMRAEMMREANKDQGAPTREAGAVNDLGFAPDQQQQMRQAMANAIQIEKKEGFWVTIVSLAIAALLALVTVLGLRFSMSTPTPQTPPGGG